MKFLSLLAITAWLLPAEASDSLVVTSLSGAPEVPPVESTASGTITFVYSEITDSILWSMEIANPDGLGIYGMPGAHIHCGSPGFNGGVLVSLVAGGIPDNSTVIGATGQIFEADLDQVNGCVITIPNLWFAMNNGGVYVNVHSMENPSGEIRGDLPGEGGETPSEDTISTELLGENEVPPVDSTAMGSITFLYNEPLEMILWALTISNPDNLGIFGAPGAHIHCGSNTANGGVLVGLVGGMMTDNSTSIGATGEISDNDQIQPGLCVGTIPNLWAAMGFGDFVYVNVHSLENPSGEIRGQLGLATTPPPVVAPTPVPAPTNPPVAEPTFVPTMSSPVADPTTDPTTAPTDESSADEVFGYGFSVLACAAIALLA